MRYRLSLSLSWLVIVTFSFAINAHEQEVLFNEVQLQAKAEREIPNDEMQVLLVTEHQGKSPAALAEKVNQDMQWALELVKDKQEISSSTKSYRTNPIYRDRNIVGWRSSQELELKSQSITELTKLVGELQTRLQVKQMSFIPTPETRVQHENELIELAMEAFKRRVEIVSKHMDNKDYRIIKLNVNTNDQYARPVMFNERATMSTMSSAASVPTVEAGTSKIIVTVNGSVQFF